MFVVYYILLEVIKCSKVIGWIVIIEMVLGRKFMFREGCIRLIRVIFFRT